MRVLIITLTLSLLNGCQLLAPAATVQVQDRLPEVIGAEPYADLDRWLNEVSLLMAFTEEQAQAELQQSFKAKAGEPQRLFRYALLNQQLKDRLGWIRARDSLQQLSVNAHLSPALQSLVRVLQFHNQAMINADARHSRLLNALQEDELKQQQLTNELLLSQQQTVDLSEKIEALTNLEKSMNIRRALTTDTPKGIAND